MYSFPDSSDDDDLSRTSREVSPCKEERGSLTYRKAATVSGFGASNPRKKLTITVIRTPAENQSPTMDDVKNPSIPDHLEDVSDTDSSKDNDRRQNILGFEDISDTESPKDDERRHVLEEVNDADAFNDDGRKKSILNLEVLSSFDSSNDNEKKHEDVGTATSGLRASGQEGSGHNFHESDFSVKTEVLDKIKIKKELSPPASPESERSILRSSDHASKPTFQKKSDECMPWDDMDDLVLQDEWNDPDELEEFKLVDECGESNHGITPSLHQNKISCHRQNATISAPPHNVIPRNPNLNYARRFISDAEMNEFCAKTYDWFEEPTQSKIGKSPIDRLVTTWRKPQGPIGVYTVSRLEDDVAYLTAVKTELFFPNRADLRILALSSSATNTLQEGSMNPAEHLVIGDIIFVQKILPSRSFRRQRTAASEKNMRETRLIETLRRDFVPNWCVDRFQVFR